MSLDLVRAMLDKLLLTVRAGSPFAARCWLTSVTTACSAVFRPETFAVDEVLEDAEDATAELAVLDDVEDVDLEEVVEVVLDAAEDAALEDVEDAGADAAAEVQPEGADEGAAILHPAPAEVQPLFCEGAAADEQDVLQAVAAFFCPNNDRTYCCTSLQVPWTQETTVLQAEFIELQELAVWVWGDAAATDSGNTVAVTATATIFFHVKRKVFSLLFGGGQTCRCADVSYPTKDASPKRMPIGAPMLAAFFYEAPYRWQEAVEGMPLTTVDRDVYKGRLANAARISSIACFCTVDKG